MKLPEPFNLYKHNEESDNLYNLAALFVKHFPYEDSAPVAYICESNIDLLRRMKAIILHLELVLDEVMLLENNKI